MNPKVKRKRHHRAGACEPNEPSVRVSFKGPRLAAKTFDLAALRVGW